jgi:aminoglycoside phosphotransferase (APT) family kinase protein
MKTLLRRIVTAASRKRQAGAAIVQWQGTMRLSNLRAVKDARGGNATNKAGRIVLRGESGGQPVKVYEAFNEEHAAFIGAVGALDPLRGMFPSILGQSGRFVAAAWLEGKSIRQAGLGSGARSVLRELVELQATLHSIPADSLPRCGFDYWRDLLRPRFMRAMELIGENQLAAQATATVDAGWDGRRRVLIHPDVTPVNVIRNPHGTLSIIDNELLATGGLPLVDLCNTVRAMGRSYAAEYATMYLARMSTRLAEDEAAQLEAMWFARCVGSDFVAGQIGTMCYRVQMFKAGVSQLPFSAKDLTTGSSGR